MSEIFPVKVRGFASAVCVLTNWSMAFIVTKTFQDMMVSDQQHTAFLFLLSSCVLDIPKQFPLLLFRYLSINNYLVNSQWHPVKNASSWSRTNSCRLLNLKSDCFLTQQYFMTTEKKKLLCQELECDYETHYTHVFAGFLYFWMFLWDYFFWICHFYTRAETLT